MCFWKVKDGHLTILTNCPFPSFWSKILRVNTKSVSGGRMFENSTNLLSKWKGKWSGNELENDFLIASILGTGKSIDF